MERDEESSSAACCGSISTHTLTWSVTISCLISELTKIISTHTLTWSVTSLPYIVLPLLSNFNSHAHVERDDKINTDRYCYQNFNSHAHVERDFNFLGIFEWLGISTHTLTWSVTLKQRVRQ